MGLFQSKPLVTFSPHDFISVLHKQGLSQLYLFSQDHDMPQEPYPEFDLLCKQLRPIFKAALTKSKLKEKQLTPEFCQYIYYQLSHHTMKCMLANPLMDVSIRFNQLQKGKEKERYALPAYEQSNIETFLDTWQSSDKASSFFPKNEPTASLARYMAIRANKALSKPFPLAEFIVQCIDAYYAIQDLAAGKQSAFLPYELSIEEETILEGPDKDGLYEVIFT